MIFSCSVALVHWLIFVVSLLYKIASIKLTFIALKWENFEKQWWFGPMFFSHNTYEIIIKLGWWLLVPKDIFLSYLNHIIHLTFSKLGYFLHFSVTTENIRVGSTLVPIIAAQNMNKIFLPLSIASVNLPKSVCITVSQIYVCEPSEAWGYIKLSKYCTFILVIVWKHTHTILNSFKYETSILPK